MMNPACLRRGEPIRNCAAMVLASACSALGSAEAHGQCVGTEYAALLPADGAELDEFGCSVAISGDIAVIGALWDDDQGEDSGSAYVFRFDGSGWQEEAKLLPSDGAAEEWFGYSVAALDDTILIGAPWDDDNGGHSGSAYVFRYDGSGWVEQDKLLALDGEEQDLFGHAVALGSGVAVIGASGDAECGYATGAAYVFRLDGSFWVQEAKLQASDADAYAHFGCSAGLSGDGVAIGARGDDANGSYAGAVYVFRFEDESWVEEAKLMASDGDEFDDFGYSLAILDDTLVVGAYHDEENGEDSGSAYVFRFDGQTWHEQAKLLASSGAENDRFGIAVAVFEHAIIAGANGADYLGSSTGLAFVFAFDGTEWSEAVKLRASDAGLYDHFGYSVAAEGETVIVGAYGHDGDAETSGAAYLYAGFADCNENGTIDLCDVADGTSLDCQPNGLPDECDLADGTSEDVNDNGIPDECEDICPADFDADGQVDTADLLYLLGAWATPDGDVDGDGDTDTADLLALLATWGDCPPCIWDFNDDGVVDDLDRDILMEHWGDCPDPPEECPWDLNGDGVVNGLDLMELLEHYGPC